MTYPEILTSNLLYLPFSYSGKPFYQSITELLTTYLDCVESMSNDELPIENLPGITGEFIKRAQKKFVDGLIKSIGKYYNGKPAQAYDELFRTLKNDQKNFGQILKLKTYESNTSFFRIRLKSDNNALLPADMFHIPFNLRGLITTQRYSIPGFPSLYLGKTVYGCWEEMNRPDINHFQVARLKNIIPIKYLDLTRPEYGDNLMSREIYHYFMTWPLIACCSAKVSDYSHSFKSEYILPQLLLQWVREEQEIDGIRFNSTHIDFHNTKSKGDFSNLVMPVKENAEKGHCQRLKTMFEISNPISWQLYEHAIGGGQNFLFTDEQINSVNNRISKLELIKGKAYPYSFSVLGKLEGYLDSLDTQPI